MITNAREYATTRKQLQRLEAGLQQAHSASPSDTVHPDIHSAELRAVQSEVARLRAELAEYDSLSTGAILQVSTVDLDALPKVLVQARIANGLTQRQLAERIGIHEQQVQRYESTAYRKASFSRLLEVAEALGLQVQQTATFAGASIGKALKELRKRGFSDDFIASRLFGSTTAQELATSASGASRGLATCERMFGWTVPDIAAGALAAPSLAHTGGARFKLSDGRRQDHVQMYTAYAYRIACGAARCAAHLPQPTIPSDAAAMRRSLPQGALTLRDVVNWAWEHGVVVIPLDDPGAFHAAFWRIDHRNIIVLKQRTSSADRLAHDLLHDIFHAAQEPDLPSRTVVDIDDPLQSDDEEEEDANWFAVDVLLNGAADDLIRAVMRTANNRGPRLKAAVQAVARRQEVPVGVLANHLAWTLDHQDVPFEFPWWGTAANLQSDNGADLQWMRRLCFERLVATDEDDPDVDLLFRALRSGVAL